MPSAIWPRKYQKRPSAAASRSSASARPDRSRRSSAARRLSCSWSSRASQRAWSGPDSSARPPPQASVKYAAWRRDHPGRRRAVRSRTRARTRAAGSARRPSGSGSRRRAPRAHPRPAGRRRRRTPRGRSRRRTCASAGEDLAFSRREQLEAPVDRRAQRTMARSRVAPCRPQAPADRRAVQEGRSVEACATTVRRARLRAANLRAARRLRRSLRSDALIVAGETPAAAAC